MIKSTDYPQAVIYQDGKRDLLSAYWLR